MKLLIRIINFLIGMILVHPITIGIKIINEAILLFCFVSNKIMDEIRLLLTDSPLNTVTNPLHYLLHQLLPFYNFWKQAYEDLFWHISLLRYFNLIKSGLTYTKTAKHQKK